MTRTAKKTNAPKSRFVIIKQDCNNFEGDFTTMDGALRYCQDQMDSGNWESYELDYVRILTVTEVHTISSKLLEAIPTDLTDIED